MDYKSFQITASELQAKCPLDCKQEANKYPSTCKDCKWSGFCQAQVQAKGQLAMETKRDDQLVTDLV